MIIYFCICCCNTVGGIICLSPPINQEGGGRLFFFTGVNGVRWKSPVVPGDQLIMEMSLLQFDERMGFATMTGKAYVGGKVISCEMLIFLSIALLSMLSIYSRCYINVGFYH